MKLLDIPGLVPATMNGKVNSIPKRILAKYSNEKKHGSIDLLLCQSAKCDSPPGIGETIPNLSNILIVLTKIDKVSAHLLCLSLSSSSNMHAESLTTSSLCYLLDKSADNDWEDYYDEEDPEAEKSGRYWRLS